MTFYNVHTAHTFHIRLLCEGGASAALTPETTHRIVGSIRSGNKVKGRGRGYCVEEIVSAQEGSRGKCGARAALTPVQRSTYGITGQTRRTHKFSPMVGRRKRSIASTKVKHVVAPTDTRTRIWLWGREAEIRRDVCRGRNSRVRSQDGHGARGTERNMDRNIDGVRSKGRSKERSTEIFMAASRSRYGTIDAC